MVAMISLRTGSYIKYGFVTVYRDPSGPGTTMHAGSIHSPLNIISGGMNIPVALIVVTTVTFSLPFGRLARAVF